MWKAGICRTELRCSDSCLRLLCFGEHIPRRDTQEFPGKMPKKAAGSDGGQRGSGNVNSWKTSCASPTQLEWDAVGISPTATYHKKECVSNNTRCSRVCSPRRLTTSHLKHSIASRICRGVIPRPSQCDPNTRPSVSPWTVTIPRTKKCTRRTALPSQSPSYTKGRVCERRFTLGRYGMRETCLAMLSETHQPTIEVYMSW